MPKFHFLVAGLGNITHPATRHSIGHYLIDALASRLGTRLASERNGHSTSTEVDIEGSPVTVTFFKPRALMNISGRPVVQTLRGTAVESANLIVMHDSLEHKPCAISPKFGGSANGHNGVRSIIAALGNDKDFYRLRLGIGRGGDVTEYVLGPLSHQEREFWSATGSGSDLVWKELIRMMGKRLQTR